MKSIAGFCRIVTLLPCQSRPGTALEANVPALTPCPAPGGGLPASERSRVLTHWSKAKALPPCSCSVESGRCTPTPQQPGGEGRNFILQVWALATREKLLWVKVALYLYLKLHWVKNILKIYQYIKRHWLHVFSWRTTEQPWRVKLGFSTLLNCSNRPLAEVWPRRKSTLHTQRTVMNIGVFSTGNLDVAAFFWRITGVDYPTSAELCTMFNLLVQRQMLVRSLSSNDSVCNSCN